MNNEGKVTVEEFHFFRARPGGKVHISFNERVNALGKLEKDAHPLLALMSCLKAICGRTGRTAERLWVTDFDDSDLCPSCYKAFPEEDRPRLFSEEARALPKEDTKR